MLRIVLRLYAGAKWLSHYAESVPHFEQVKEELMAMVPPGDTVDRPAASYASKFNEFYKAYKGLVVSVRVAPTSTTALL